MLLRQISPNDDLTRVVIEALESTAPILKDLKDAQFYTKAGSSDNVKKAAGGHSGNATFRDLNEEPTITAGERTYEPVAKKILSIQSKVDIILEKRGEDPESELVVETRNDAMEAGWLLQEKFFKGDSAVNSKEFDGLYALVPADNLIAEEIVVPTGISDSAMSQQQIALEKLLQFISKVRGGATHLYMPEALKIRWLTVAKNLGYYRQNKDELGNTIDMIGDVVIRGAGRQKDGSEIMDFNETVTNNDCASIIAVRWGERVDLTCLTTSGIIAEYLGQVGKFLINSVDLDMAIVLQNNTALYQWRGWRLNS
ncbi:MAG: hypothetical protein H0Z28_11170 [Archaeoglobus sp.]|nr:hypothetical protein [Archaeoglobus sp.]